MNGLAASIVEVIGETPVVALGRLTAGLRGRIIAKLDYLNPIDPLRAVALKQVRASWGGTGATRYTFTPVDGGTRVDWTWELIPTGLMKFLMGPMLPIARRMFQTGLDNLKALMESGRITP